MARIGVAKTERNLVIPKIVLSRFIYTLTLKITCFYIFKIHPLQISQNHNKIKQNPNFPIPKPLSYPISSKPTKIKHFSHFTTQKSNFHLTKNSPIISKLSLFISTFTDNDFSSKNSKSYNPNIGDYHKTTRKTIKTVITLSYFLRKK